MNTEEVDMAYFFLRQSTLTICNRLRRVDTGMNKIFSDAKAKENKTDAEYAMIKRMGEKLQKLQIAEGMVVDRNTYFQTKLESRMGFFKSLIPGTEENRIRRDLSASIQQVEEKISQFTHEIQNFTNVGLKAKL